jgi:E3 ubiquitin-protein ligase UBR4
MAILHVGSAQQVRTGSTSSKEDDYESDAATIVQKCVSQVSQSLHPFPGQCF